MERDVMTIMKKHILVTGGAGFLGSHLCEKLLQEGAMVTCVDNLVTGSRAQIAGISASRQFRIIHHDITTPLDPDVLQWDPIDEIYNLACPASPVQYQKNPVHTLKTSVYGAVNMLDLARQFNSTVLQTSTSEVYGDPEIHPQHESYHGNVNPLGTRSCYEEGKRAAETLFMDYYRQYGLRIKIARLFNVYGPRMQMNDGRVIPNFILQALGNQPITLYGDGRQTRSFCYIDDTLRGLLSLMQSDSGFIGPVNIGNTHEISMVELAETIIDLTGSASTLSFKPKPEDDPARRRPDISLARSVLDWEPVFTLREGLIRTIAYFETLCQSRGQRQSHKTETGEVA